MELDTVRLLVDAGVLVVCAGGGGVPVVAAADGALTGVEAVVDKDLAAALLAIELEADALLLLTDVPAVQAGWSTPEARDVREATPAELRRLNSPPARWDRRSRRPDGSSRLRRAAHRSARLMTPPCCCGVRQARGSARHR